MSTIENPVTGDDTYRGRLNPAASSGVQPAATPLYPPLPWKAFNAKCIVIEYETDLDPVLDLLPPELTPLTYPPHVVCLLNGGCDWAMGGGPYAEMLPLIPVLYEGEPHMYRWTGYLSEGSEEWFAAGRELLGNPVKYAKIELKQQVGRGLMMGTVERPTGHPLVTQIVGPLGWQGDEADFNLYPMMGVRVLPDSSGQTPEVAELYRADVEATVRIASDGSPMVFSGPGTIVLEESVQDPLYLLPVRKVVSAQYVELGTITHKAIEVLKSYTHDDSALLDLARA